MIAGIAGVRVQLSFLNYLVSRERFCKNRDELMNYIVRVIRLLLVKATSQAVFSMDT